MNRADVDIYPVGALSVLISMARSLVVAVPPGVARRKVVGLAFGRVRWHVRYLREQAAGRNWGAVRSALNGYLAEPNMPIEFDRCGHGWTRRRALRDLERHLASRPS
jgi:hypothetical protein